eukprot:2944472-Rhodomonas_salina.1
MRCSVRTPRMVLRLRYAMCGTHVVCSAASYMLTMRCAVLTKRMMLLTMRCAVLTWRTVAPIAPCDTQYELGV